jgi:Reductase C-terminal/GTP cyclohydrolase I
VTQTHTAHDAALELATPPWPAERRRIDLSGAERAAADLLRALGADVSREDLRETPRRMAESYAELLTPTAFRPTRSRTTPATTRWCSPARSPSTRCAPTTCCPSTGSPTSPGVFAAGDVASAEHPLYGRPLRVEHWANALKQGVVAARNMLGEDVPFDAVPYFFSDQYEIGMEYSGHTTAWDRVILRGDASSREFIAFWIEDERVVAGMNVNVGDVTEAIQELVRSGVVVDPSRLADPGVPLPELLAA